MAVYAPYLFDAGWDGTMIELTPRQIKALDSPESPLPRFVNPRTGETSVLLRVEEYQRLKEEEYDDGSWTREELHALAWETGRNLGWDEMDEYDDDPETP